MNEQQERAEFQKEWERKNWPLPMNSRMKGDSRYAVQEVEVAWRFWKAGRAAALTAPPPAPDASALLADLPELAEWLAAHHSIVTTTEAYNAAVMAANLHDEAYGFGSRSVNDEYQAMNAAGNRAHKLVKPLLAALAARFPPSA